MSEHIKTRIITSSDWITPEIYTRYEMAQRVLGDRIAIRSAALSKLTGSQYERISVEQSAIFSVRKNLYMVQSLDEIEIIIKHHFDALLLDKLKFK